MLSSDPSEFKVCPANGDKAESLELNDYILVGEETIHALDTKIDT